MIDERSAATDAGRSKFPKLKLQTGERARVGDTEFVFGGKVMDKLIDIRSMGQAYEDIRTTPNARPAA